MRILRIGHLMAVAVMALWLSGCVAQSKYQALETTSAAERGKLQEELASLKTHKQVLESQTAALEQEAATLRQALDRANLELESAHARLAQTEQQSAALIAQKDEELRRQKGTYDTLVRDLQGEIEKGEIKVTQIRDQLSVNLVEKVLFDSGQAEVKQQGKDVLRKVGKILSTTVDKEIRIEGYTDNVPIKGALKKRFPSNWELSAQRAINVLRFLQEDAGVDGTRLSAVGYGKFRPVADNETAEGRAQNRRIEIVLIPAGVKEVLNNLD